MFKRSMLLVTGLFAVLLSSPSILKAQEHPLMGVNHPPLPKEVEKIGGWSAENPYSIARIDADGEELLLLNRLMGRDSSGKGSYQVVNVLYLPAINPETEEIMGGSLCRSGGKEANNMIFIVKWEEDKPYLTKARKVWKVEAEKFVEINPQSVNFQCENLAYGL